MTQSGILTHTLTHIKKSSKAQICQNLQMIELPVKIRGVGHRVLPLQIIFFMKKNSDILAII